MPKKHQRFHFKPSAQAHHSLALGSNQNGAPGASGGSTTSVNDLISHLRRTQPPSSSEDGIPRRPHSTLTPRSVHPSLRNLLEIPETQPPRPRPLSYRTAIGARPVRPTVGPPPPESWLSARTDDDPTSESLGDRGTDMETIIYRLKRLPGTTFPDNGSLMHLVLKKMALNWAWHLEYDGVFLSELPNNLKCLLLSYIAVFARGQPLDRQMKGLSPLFSTQQDRAQSSDDESEFEEFEFDRDVGTTRLDLGGAIGNWMSFKRLTNELINLHSSPMHAVRNEREEYIPNSWDEEENSGHDEATDEPTHATYAPSIPKQLTRKNRFENLRFLSLAHPKPAAASWTSLIKLLSRLPTITHLSLAHWPTPTRTPGAVNARIRHPTIHSLTFSYSGTDNYASLDNAWAEAASVLRHLSRSTRCLQWLDLEGCADWLPALNWVGEDPNGVPYRPGAVGPDWNGSWREVGWISLGPGWIPNLDDNKDMSHTSQVLNPDPADPPWRAEEQANARRLKKLGAYREQFQTALAVRKNLRLIRKEGRGKWLQVSLGLDDVDPQIVRQLVGQDYALHE